LIAFPAKNCLRLHELPDIINNLSAQKWTFLMAIECAWIELQRLVEIADA
jgi:hypothetical protein